MCYCDDLIARFDLLAFVCWATRNQADYLAIAFIAAQESSDAGELVIDILDVKIIRCGWAHVIGVRIVGTREARQVNLQDFVRLQRVVIFDQAVIAFGEALLDLVEILLAHAPLQQIIFDPQTPQIFGLFGSAGPRLLCALDLYRILLIKGVILLEKFIDDFASLSQTEFETIKNLESRCCIGDSLLVQDANGEIIKLRTIFFGKLINIGLQEYLVIQVQGIEIIVEEDF